MALSGKRILITRAAEDLHALADKIRARGAVPIPFPCIAFAEPDASSREDRERAIDRLVRDPPAAIGLASPRAVETLVSLLRLRVIEPENDGSGPRDAVAADREVAKLLSRSIVASAGEGTAAALAKLGIASIHPEDAAGADALAELLLHALKDQPGARVLLPQAAKSTPQLAGKLRDAGFSLEVAVFYQTVPLSALTEAHAGGLALLRAHQVDAIAFASGSAATGFAQICGTESVSLAASTRVACMGSSCSRVAEGLGFQVAAVGASGFDSMLDALAACYSSRDPPAGDEASPS